MSKNKLFILFLKWFRLEFWSKFWIDSCSNSFEEPSTQTLESILIKVLNWFLFSTLIKSVVQSFAQDLELVSVLNCLQKSDSNYCPQFRSKVWSKFWIEFSSQFCSKSWIELLSNFCSNDSNQFKSKVWSKLLFQIFEKTELNRFLFSILWKGFNSQFLFKLLFKVLKRFQFSTLIKILNWFWSKVLN